MNRDIKLENILLCDSKKRSTVKLADFGFSKVWWGLKMFHDHVFIQFNYAPLFISYVVSFHLLMNHLPYVSCTKNSPCLHGFPNYNEI